MIKYTDTKITTFKKIKKVESAVVCDICKAEISSNTHDPIVRRYYCVTTGHRDWGNDSFESVKDFHVCPNCIVSFTADYLLKNKNSSTAYIEIESDTVFPNVKYEEVEE